MEDTDPRTGMCRSLAALTTSWNLSMLSSMEQLMFFLLNVSDADPNTATSVAPASTFTQEKETLHHIPLSQTFLVEIRMKHYYTMRPRPE